MFDEHLVTVWSAPNYCYRCGNIAAILAFHTATNHETKLFNAVPDSQRSYSIENNNTVFSLIKKKRLHEFFDCLVVFFLSLIYPNSV